MLQLNIRLGLGMEIIARRGKIFLVKLGGEIRERKMLVKEISFFFFDTSKKRALVGFGVYEL